MSYQTYIDDAATRNGAYAEPGSAAHHHYQNFYYPPPEVPAAEHSTQPASAPAHCQPASVSQWEYDPFSHSEHPPIPSDDDPPPLPPMDEAPPLPADDAPPLPSTPATIQDQPLVPPEQSVPGSQQQPAAYAEQSHTPAPQEAAFQPPNAQGTPTDPQPTWLAYQYPGMAEPQVLPQQDPWQQQQYQYASAYQAYSQATPVYQPPLWQAQAQVAPPWQQQQIPATVSQPQTQHPWQPQAPIQPQPPTLPAPVMPAPQPQAIPRVVHDISNILLIPGRSNRPKRVSIVLRGLPGSGKSYLAKKMKVVEVEQGGDAPRIHAIDDYFVTEVEKEVAEEVPGKKSRKRTMREMEYCYEAELEGTYKASLLRAYERTVREARFALVIVDAPNLYAEDLKPYWTAGQRGGYEVYIAEVEGSTPEACHRQNTHNRTLPDIQQAAAAWQETPAVYPVLDVSFLTGAGVKKSSQTSIAEVEMEDNSDADVSEDEATPKLVSSKWSSTEAAPSNSRASKRALGQGQGSNKRAKAEAALLDDTDYDGLTAGLDGYFGKKQGRKGMHDNASSTRGVLKKAGAAGHSRSQSVRWADEEPEGQSGFRIGGSQQLETIYVLEGLGPPKDPIQKGKTFKDQIRAEHNAERRAFRDVLLGGRRA